MRLLTVAFARVIRSPQHHNFPLLLAVGLIICSIAFAVEPASEHPQVRPPSNFVTTFISDTNGVHGRQLCVGTPVNWTAEKFDDSGWSDATSTIDASVSDAGMPPGCKGTSFWRWMFNTSDESPQLELLTLKIRYRHGIAVYLNGQEVVRKRLRPGALPDEYATDTHGPEIESFTIPIRPGLLKSRANILAVEAHPRSGRGESAVALELEASAKPRIVRGPYIQWLSASEMAVVVDTNAPTRSDVIWREGEDKWRRTPAPTGEAAIHHELHLSRLEPGHRYTYQVRLYDATLPLQPLSQSAIISMRMPPDSKSAVRFIVYGDVRSGHAVHGELIQQMIKEEPDFALLTGDLVDRGTDDADWDRFFAVAAPFIDHVPIFPSTGNHDSDRKATGLPQFLRFFPSATAHGANERGGYYDFSIANFDFLALDSNQYRSSTQQSWLEEKLRNRSQTSRGTFVIAHEPPYSAGLHGTHSFASRVLVPLMEKYRMSYFFGGHDHDYERGQVGKFRYIVSGGGGAELRAPRCGVAPLPACAPEVKAFINEHHYVLVEILPTFFRVCPKRPDGTPLEACQLYSYRP